MIGINISGAEFGGTGGTHDSQYHYPTLSELQFYKNHGVDLVRLPFSWERMQNTLGGALDPKELALLKGVLADAATLGLDVIVDLHNYGRYNDVPIGAPNGPTNAQFADFWKMLASELKSYPSLVGYDLMNEPHDMPFPDAWKNAAQAAVNAIRLVDTDNVIYVEGNDWAGAHSWMTSNANFFITDPANKLIYQAHQYFDKYNQGFYHNSYEDEGAYPMVGVDRLKPFVEWLKANNLQGMIGEFGVPSNDPRWLEVQKNAIDYMNANNLDATAWGGGTWWPSDYPMFMGAPGRTDSAYFNQLEGFFGQYDGYTPVAPTAPTPPPPPPTVPVTSQDIGQTINGTPGDDIIKGQGGNDTINGNGGADVVDGGNGIDTMSYHWSGAHVDVDLLRAVQHNGDATGDRLTNVENLRGSAHNDALRGDDLANVINGLGGRDVMAGRGGSDTFVFSSAAEANGDVVLDYSASDKLDFSAFAALFSLSNNGVDTVIAGDTNSDGIADFSVTLKGVHTTVNGVTVTAPAAPAPVLPAPGVSINDVTVNENAGTMTFTLTRSGSLINASTVQFATANSTAAAGSDYKDAAGTVTFAAGETVKTITISVINDTLVEGIETLTVNLTNGTNVTIMDGRGDGTIISEDGATLPSSVGAAVVVTTTGEVLLGSDGIDALSGGAGADILVGGGGADRLTGGLGSDRFVFDSVANTRGDRVTDFNLNEDKLDFSQTDANVMSSGDQAFTFIESRDFSRVAGELRSYLDGPDTIISGDVTGDGIADFSVVLSSHVFVSSLLIYL